MKNKNLYILATSFIFTILLLILFAIFITCLYALIIPGILLVINIIVSIYLIKKHKINYIKKSINFLG